MSRKLIALVVMTVGIGAGIPAAAQLVPPLNTGTGRYMVQYRSGLGFPWRLFTRTRSRRRAYVIAAQVRSAGYQARVVYGSYYASMPYYGYGYGYGYPRYGRRGYGYGGYRFNPALTSNNVTGAISALTSSSQHNPLVSRLVPGSTLSGTASNVASRTGAAATNRQISPVSMAQSRGQQAMVHNVTRHALGPSAASAGMRSQMASLRAHSSNVTRAVGRSNSAAQHAAMAHAAVHMNRAMGMGSMPRVSFPMGGMPHGGGGGIHGGGGGFHAGGFHGGGGGSHGGGGHR